MTTEGQPRAGMRVRREVLGTRTWTGRSRHHRVHRALQDFITRYAWGEIWSRPGLTRPERSIVTLTVLAALQHEEELPCT